MRKILLSLSALLAFGVAHAQNDISVTLNSPTASSTIGPGLPFAFDVTITNLGTADVTANDTVIFYPTVNGGLLTTNQNGQNVTVAFRLTGTTISTNGMETRAVNFGGLNITGAPAGNIDICGNAFVVGPNWNNVTESDTVNNTDCASVAYDPNGGGTVGLAENMVYADIKSVPLLDVSYASGSTYFVEVYNVSSASALVSFVDLTGRTLMTQEFEVSNSELKGEVSLSNLPQGVVLAVLSVDGQAVSTKKVVVAH
tara:strand:+ start:34218 stop:34985 length:768 start_codon:yes stop_codon:yes gene_type:complete